MGKKLYVGNLPFQTTEGDLEQLFGEMGAVDSVRIITDRETGRNRGFGFIEMSSDEDADKSIEKFNQYELEGRALTVNEARPREDRGVGGSGGGGGYRRDEPRW
jgi:RNA recognition motif-containing protein